MKQEIKVPGKDFCDMSKSFDTPFEEFSIVNAMLPTKVGCCVLTVASRCIMASTLPSSE